MKKANRQRVETIRTVAASIVDSVELADGTAEDARQRLRVIKSDAKRIERLARMLTGATEGTAS